MFTREYLLSLPGRKSIIDRLTEKSAKRENGCIEFLGSKDRCGYGRMNVGGHNLGTHKLMFVLTVEDVPDGMELLHSCDNPACMNTVHLSINTHRANMRDCIQKGRFTTFGTTVVSIARFSSRSLAISDGKKIYIGRNCKRHRIGFRLSRNGECIYCYKESNVPSRKLLIA